MTVRLSERARTAISEHTSASGTIAACGLLIGRRDENGIVVERSLRCFNVAPPELRIGGFQIDPRVHVNVRRSLTGTGSSVVGFYYGSPGFAEGPGDRDLEHLRLWPDTALLIQGPPVDGEARIRIWTQPGDEPAPVELPIEIVPMRYPSLLICPE